MDDLLIGIDYGSDSVRALLVTKQGETLAECVHPYDRWNRGLYIDAMHSMYRQHPLDYLEGLKDVVRGVLQGQDSSLVRGIGIDTTGSTPCAVDGKGIPLALYPEFAEDPDAMFVLWKDHTAAKESDEINNAAKHAPVDYTKYEGGVYSPEWFWSKYLHILRNNERVRSKCAGFVEHCDWITALLAGVPVRASRCAAGHKAMWHPDWNGLPPEEFLSGVDPLLKGRRDTLYRETFTADIPLGTLSPEWAAALGLPSSVVVAGGLFDGHAGAVGAGIAPGIMVKVMGTSSCDFIVAPEIRHCVKGICGQVDGSVLPGMTALEAGQAAFGDIFAWFKRFLSYAGAISLSRLESDAASVAPGTVLALDWMNGRRTPDLNPHLQGVLYNLTLGTTPPMVYRALVEAALFGTRRIADRYKENGVCIDVIRATGGIAKKSALVMQTCADILNMPVHIVNSDQTCALGAAMYAAAASGVYPAVRNAQQEMDSGIMKEYVPDPANAAVYEKLYRKYLSFGESAEKEIMSHI